MKTYQVNKEGYYGEFGGAYIPEILHRCVEELQNAYSKVLESEGFKQEFHQLLRDYVGRPSPLYLANRLSKKYGCKIYLKREDLNHTGAHKINNAIGQVLLAKRMGKKRIIAETGAGQHGVATATVCALMNMQCIVYMGKTDVERQHINVEKMKMLGAEVRPVTSGNMTLKDATNEAIRDWCCHPADTYYVIGSTVGPHPYPDMVARLQSVISEEIKKQLKEQEGREYPDYLMACVGGGSNAAGCPGRGRRQRYRHRFLGRYHPTGENGNYPRSKDLGYPKRGRTNRGTLLHFCRSGLSGHRTHACQSGQTATRFGTRHKR